LLEGCSSLDSVSLFVVGSGLMVFISDVIDDVIKVLHVWRQNENQIERRRKLSDFFG